MIGELIIIGITLYALFGPYMSAKAYELREKAHKMEIENDRMEMGYYSDENYD